LLVEVAVSEYVVAVAPLMSLNVSPLLACHCTVGVGDPLAAAENETVTPAGTD